MAPCAPDHKPRHERSERQHGSGDEENTLTLRLGDAEGEFVFRLVRGAVVGRRIVAMEHPVQRAGEKVVVWRRGRRQCKVRIPHDDQPRTLHLHAGIARGSALECAAILDAAEILRIIEPSMVVRGNALLARIVAMLTKMAR